MLPCLLEGARCATAVPPCLSGSLADPLLQILRSKGRLLCHLISPYSSPLQEEGSTIPCCRQSCVLSLAGGRSLSLSLAEGRAVQLLTHVTGSVSASGQLQPRHGASACPGTSGVSFSSKPCFQLGLNTQTVPLLLEASS